MQQVQEEDLGIREVIVVGFGVGYRLKSGEESRVVQLALGAHVPVRAVALRQALMSDW